MSNKIQRLCRLAAEGDISVYPDLLTELRRRCTEKKGEDTGHRDLVGQAIHVGGVIGHWDPQYPDPAASAGLVVGFSGGRIRVLVPYPVSGGEMRAREKSPRPEKCFVLAPDALYGTKSWETICTYLENDVQITTKWSVSVGEEVVFGPTEDDEAASDRYYAELRTGNVDVGLSPEEELIITPKVRT